MRALFVQAIWVWVAFFVLAVLNGLLRESLYVPELGNLGGRILGTLVLVLAMLVVTWLFLRRNRESLTRLRLIELGVLWLGLSLFFEFAVSHWVMEESWEVIRAHYNVMEGRFHVLVRLVELAGPIILGGRMLPGSAGYEDAPPAHEGGPLAESDAAPPAGSGDA
jgi:hypothetical protein